MPGHTKNNWKSLKIGIVFSTALVLLVLVVINLEGIDKLFAKNDPLYVVISDVNGLSIGAPVFVRGFEVGNVGSISLQPDGVLVTLLVRRSALSLIKKNATAEILSWGLLGDKYVEISRGTSPAPFIEKGDTIPGQETPGLEQIVKASLESVHLVETFISKLDTLAVNVESGQGLVGGLLKDSILYQQVRHTASALSHAADAFENNKGTFSHLIRDDNLYNGLLSTVAAFDTLGNKLGNGSGTIPRLINDSTAYRNINMTLLHIQNLTDSLDASAAFLKSLNDTTFTYNLKSTIDQLKKLIAGINSHPDRYFRVKIF
jgi:phospholipid/cholesterol/gamma-HCH transport system substrate-binding protein